MPTNRETNPLSGLILITDKEGKVGSDLRLAAQILRSSTQSKVLAREEILGILESEGVKKSDISRIYRNLLKGGFIEKIK